jgi:signal transduction histidine kinase
LVAIYTVTGLALRRFTRIDRTDAGLRDVAVFVGISGASVTAAALVYVGAYLVDGTMEFERVGRVFSKLWIGDLVGFLIVGPLLLQLRARAWRTVAVATRVWVRDAAIAALALMLILAVIFASKPLDEFRTSYLLYLPTIVIALRYGLFGAALALLPVQLGVLGSVVFFQPVVATALEFQLLMLTLALTTLCIGALASERERSMHELARRERESRAQQEALARAQRSASTAELAAALAHELNQPLSAIGTYARAGHVLAAAEPLDRGRLLSTLERVAAESSRAGDYVRRLRDFFRTGALRRESIGVAQLIAAARALLDDRMKRERVDWRCEIAPGLPALRVDRIQFGTVLVNLFGNAIDAMNGVAPRRLIVRARLAAAAGRIRIEVEDSGAGVPTEMCERLFQPLATSKPDGMGLGLALSRTIVERHGGKLWHESRGGSAHGYGPDRKVTVFCLEVPIDD